MIRTLLHIVLACVVTLAPPGAAMIEYSCETTGDAQVLSTLGAGNYSDPCCDDEGDTTAFAGAEDCCRATVFSLPQTSPAPTQLAGNATPMLVAFDARTPDVSLRLANIRASLFDCARFSRNLPLLV